MNIAFNIGIYMLASSTIMIGFVWFKNFQHSQFHSEEISGTNNFMDEVHSVGENLAA